MRVHTSISAYDSDVPAVVTIGTFDGVHIGNKEIIKRLNDVAAKENLESVVLTFFPHPRMVLQKESDIKLINTITERKEILSKTGLQHLIVHPFTSQFSRLTALEFVRDILVNKLHVKKIIIGYDHRFGRNRTADINDLKEYGKAYDFEVEEISAQQLDAVAVSSTKIRKALDAGDIQTANDYLGYPFALHGTIVKGKGIGRTMGFPTANLDIAESYKIIPKNGVYLVQTLIDGKNIFGLMSIGTNPTVGGTSQTIETYFLDFERNLYGANITIEMLTKIRDEEKFASVEALQEAIKKDENFARNFLAENYAQ